MPIETDVLIIGCGIAGAVTALGLAQDQRRKILVITRTPNLEESNTWYAQGGIVGRGPEDSPELLEQDIISAGAECCQPEAVRILVEKGPEILNRILIDNAQVPFERGAGDDLAYTREGGHSERRILHVGDATGKAIAAALIARLRQLPNVTFQNDMTAVDLISSSHHDINPLAQYAPITCYGAYGLDRTKRKVHRIFAKATVLATGGLGRIFRHTSNPAGARGDGLAMAYRVGARVINAEYIQFHPTTLAMPGADNFLISESVRGEGGRLYTPDGRHFMDDYSAKWGDLAPRDIVARAIHAEMLAHGYPYVLLDLASHMEASQIRERFPTIYSRCLDAGLDITVESIPVVPAAHYFCGGVHVNEWGRTTVDSLYAVGEVSCTGVHGANRLASTSLLEGLVWGDRAARDIASRDDLALVSQSRIPSWEAVGNHSEPDPALLHRDRRNIQDTMWLYVGLARNARRLARAMHDLAHLWHVIDSFYRGTRLTDELIGLRNMAQTAQIVTQAAWHNRRSRGVHYREDAQEHEPSASYDMDEPPWSRGVEF